MQLVEPVLKYLFLHPAPPPAFTSLSSHLHAQLTLIAAAEAKGGTHLAQLLLHILPLQPTNTSDLLLGAVSAVSRLLPLSSFITPTSTVGESVGVVM